jgi:hypothetical protein
MKIAIGNILIYSLIIVIGFYSSKLYFKNKSKIVYYSICLLIGRIFCDIYSLITSVINITTTYRIVITIILYFILILILLLFVHKVINKSSINTFRILKIYGWITLIIGIYFFNIAIRPNISTGSRSAFLSSSVVQIVYSITLLKLLYKDHKNLKLNIGVTK